MIGGECSVFGVDGGVLYFLETRPIPPTMLENRCCLLHSFHSFSTLSSPPRLMKVTRQLVWRALKVFEMGSGFDQ